MNTIDALREDERIFEGKMKGVHEDYSVTFYYCSEKQVNDIKRTWQECGLPLNGSSVLHDKIAYNHMRPDQIEYLEHLTEMQELPIDDYNVVYLDEYKKSKALLDNTGGNGIDCRTQTA
jgi:hypothetical protein